MSFSVMPISATAMTLVNSRRPQKTCTGINAALQATGVTGIRYRPTPKTSCPQKEKKKHLSDTEIVTAVVNV